MSPFRLFGPPPEPQATVTTTGAARHDPGITWAPGPWAGDPAPATRHARPIGLDTRPVVDGFGLPPDDPPTDPYGFPPVPALAAWPVRDQPPAPTGPPLDPREAAALAGAFAADYLSWDEDDPGRRGRVLAEHLAVPAGDAALLGWDGHGRQRAEFALPGAVRPDGDDRLLVDVRVRVTPFRPTGEGDSGGPGPGPDVPGVPAAAPAPTGDGWRGCASSWIRLIVPVVREDGRLVVDARDETPADTAAAVAATHGRDAERPAGEPASAPPQDRPVDPEPEEAW